MPLEKSGTKVSDTEASFTGVISDVVYARIVFVRILMSYEQVEESVDHMLTYIERNGGFLDDDRC